MLKLVFPIIFVAFGHFASAQKLDSTALILIDIQEFYFPGGAAALVEPEKAAEQAKLVLEYFRENKALVIHIKHKARSGADIHKLVQPVAEEKIIEKTEVNCFKGTDLDEFLKANHITKVVLAGMQTHMCLEGGTRAAADLGYDCTVVHDACATRDLKFGETTVLAKDVHFSTLATLKSYSTVIDVKSLIGN